MIDSRPTAWDHILGIEEPEPPLEKVVDRYPANTLASDDPTVETRIEALQAPLHLAWTHGQQLVGKSMNPPKTGKLFEYEDHKQQVLDVLLTLHTRYNPYCCWIKVQQVEMVIDGEPPLLIWNLYGLHGYFREGPWWDHVLSEVVPLMRRSAKKLADAHLQQVALRKAEWENSKAKESNSATDAWLNRNRKKTG